MSKLKTLLPASLLMLSACTGRTTTTSTSPQPLPQQTGNQEQTQNTNNTQQPQQTETNTANEETLPNQNVGNDTDNDVVDPNSTDTPTTTTPETTPETTPPTTPATPPPSTPANNATGTIDIQGSTIVFQDLKFTVPTGWKVHQDTFTDGTLIIAFEKGTDYFRIYARQGALPALQTVFVNGSQVTGQERDETIGGRSWKRIDTQKGQVAVAGFALSHNGHAYYGFGRSGSTQTASAVAAEFLGTMK